MTAGDRAHELPVPNRHVNGGIGTDWFAVEAAGEVVVINEAGEGSITAYTVGETTRNPRVLAAADAILWEGIVGLTHYEDGEVTISHRFAGIEERLPIDEWLDESVQTLNRTNLVQLEGVGGMVEFDCVDCGDHIERERHHMDVPGLTPARCNSCTFDRMAEGRP